jgi:hypothetical protein
MQVVLMNILEMEAIHYFHGHVNFMLHMPQISISHGLVCSINIPYVSLTFVNPFSLLVHSSKPLAMLIDRSD